MIIEHTTNFALPGNIDGPCNLEVVNGFHYVGILFTTQMSLNRMANDLSVKGKKALISVLSSLYSYGNLSKTTFFKLFDVKIVPFLLYGSELWGVKKHGC